MSQAVQTLAVRPELHAKAKCSDAGHEIWLPEEISLPINIRHRWSFIARFKNWKFKKLAEWQIWQHNKASLKARGAPWRNFLSWQLRDEAGVVFFVDDGKRWVVDVIDGATRASQTDMKFVAWGTGGTAPTESSTALSSEAAETRVTGTMSQQTTDTAGDTYQVIGTLTCNATPKSITNAGVANQSAVGGQFLIIGDHAAVPLLAGDQIEYTFKLDVDAA